MKYVIIDGLFPIVFDEKIAHKNFLNVGEITSAGFCNFTEEYGISTYGESLGLKMEPLPSDKLIIESMFMKDF